MARIVLGFVDNEKNNEFDFIQATPSKIGGQPKWLILTNIPSREAISCPKCGDVMPLLLQIYAPIDTLDYAYHRIVYVFCCRNGGCHGNNSSAPFKVLRSNCTEIDFVVDLSMEDPKKIELELLHRANVELCITCGINVEAGNKFCCKKHEIIHKLNVETKNPQQTPSFLFPLFEIVVEECDTNIDSKKNLKKCKYSLEKKLLEQYEKNGPLVDEEDNDELEQVAQSLLNNKGKFHEKTFEQFRDSMSDYPDQILRYSLNGSQLLASSHPLPNIPRCKNCKAPLQFEFQIMPQLINYLYPDNLFLANVSKFKPEDLLEWGTLLIFTCSKSCLSNTGSYIEEFIVKQDYD